MEQRISIMTLGVANLERSRKFYQRLGWRPSAASNESIVFFEVGGMALALYPRDELAKDANVATDGQGFCGMTIAYNARTRDEVDTLMTEALTAGAKILKSAEEASWGGYSGYFCDPDNFPWEVAWNPLFAIADDGSLRLSA